jgi:hypothetical protein
MLTSHTVLVVPLSKDLLKKSLTILRRLLKSRESLVACPYLCDILYDRLLYISPDPKEWAAGSPLLALYYASALIAKEKTTLKKKTALQVTLNGDMKKIYN